VFAASDFVSQSCARDPKLLGELIDSADLSRALGAAEFAARAPALSADAPEAQMQAALRAWRRRELVRIAWRDLAGWAQLPETLAELTGFADAAIGAAVTQARATQVGRYGRCCYRDSAPRQTPKFAPRRAAAPTTPTTK
jgi:glutamate-ammonia-ligase adenylyltransferase